MGEFVPGYRPALYLTGAAAAWGIATVISKRAVQEIPPLTLLPVQLAVSVVVLLAVTWIRRLPVSWSPQLRWLAALGVLNPGVSYALGLLGLARITASMSVLLWAVEPLLILLLARAVLRERIPGPVTLAIAGAMAGVVLIVAQPGATGAMAGVALTLAAVAVCAAYTIICRRLLADDTALTVVLVQQASALAFAVALLIVAYLVQPTPVLGHVSAWGWISAVASGGLYYAIAFWLYLSSLRHVTATVAGFFLTLIPVFGIGAGYLLLAERFTARQWAGAGVVVAAVLAVTLVSRHPTGPDPITRPGRSSASGSGP
jgi:probable blue pigment (indigoidine) exporter